MQITNTEKTGSVKIKRNETKLHLAKIDESYKKQGYWLYDESEEDYVYIPSAEELAI